MADNQADLQSQSKSAVFPGHLDSLGEIVDFVTSAAEAAGFEARDVQAVQLAVDEACSNIIEHAYGDECCGNIECTCCVDGDSLITTLTDRGAPFDLDAVPEPDLEAALDERTEGGLGVFIMRRLMDEIHHVFSPDSGNVLTLIKRREQPD
jgi:anti-sigma regulatory factor (Ser/Thr protein kinase)